MLSHDAVRELERIVSPPHFIGDSDELKRRTRNTLGLERRALGIICPETEEQVQAIVRAANHHRFSIYAYSTAKNIGYGERLPVTDDNLIVDLGRMNKIVQLDSELGFVDVQPGVTQGQLSDYVRAREIPFFIDATGAGRDSSIVGNSAEGGFGTTPRGNKRKEITCVRGIYGNGERFDSGYFPGSIGPDLAGLFVQSNFGIITQLRIPLNRATEGYRSFMINLHEESDLVALLEVLRELGQTRTLTSQVIVVNALDILGASRVEIPSAYANKSITNAVAAEIMGSPLASFGPFLSVGSVHGSRGEVRAKCRTIRRVLRGRLGGRADVRFMTDRSLGFLLGLLSSWPFSKIGATTRLAGPLRSFSEAHGMMQGIASDDAVIGLFGAVKDTYDDIRLMWYSSHVPARLKDVAHFVEAASSCYRRHGFEYPLEMLMVTPNDIIAIQKVDWQKGDEEQEKRARALYKALAEELVEAGYPPYRLGVQSQQRARYRDGRPWTLETLKKSFDPNGVIAPGRYGIDLAMSD